MKLIALAEARYVSRGKGTLEWFLKNFFTLVDEHGPNNGFKIYKVKSDFELTARDYPVVGIDIYPGDDYTFTVKKTVGGPSIEMHASLNDIVVKQIKTIWPKKS